tara:strand:- start:427 stop:744 length:318 start_codon:yes stop_codon:yes gene_type:complete
MSKENLISHIVIFWLKPNVSEDKKNEIITNAKKLDKISGLKSFHIGKMMPSNRDVVDNTYDFAFNMTFTSKVDLETYLNHKLHQEFVNIYIKPNIKTLKVYDFVL